MYTHKDLHQRTLEIQEEHKKAIATVKKEMPEALMAPNAFNELSFIFLFSKIAQLELEIKELKNN